MAKKKLHKKPTQKELQEKIDEDLKELDKKDEDEVEAEETTEEESPEESTEEEVKDEEEVSEEVEETEEQTEEEDSEVEEEEEKPKPEPDYKKKFTDSTREAQILASKNKKITEALAKVGDAPEPTDEELKTEYSEWDMMSDTEKKLAKTNLWNTRKVDAVSKVSEDFKDIDAWGKKVDDFIDDPQTLIDNPDLEGKVEDFKIFVTKPTRTGADFGDLISAFLFEAGQKPKSKGKMFESGTGGSKDKPKPSDGKISVEESIKLRDTDYEKYKRLLSEGKIDDSTI